MQAAPGQLRSGRSQHLVVGYWQRRRGAGEAGCLDIEEAIAEPAQQGHDLLRCAIESGSAEVPAPDDVAQAAASQVLPRALKRLCPGRRHRLEQWAVTKCEIRPRIRAPGL